MVKIFKNSDILIYAQKVFLNLCKTKIILIIISTSYYYYVPGAMQVSYFILKYSLKDNHSSRQQYHCHHNSAPTTP